MGLRLLLGFDLDRPRGPEARTADGQARLDRKLATLERLNRVLDEAGAPRTYFVCGMFLRSLIDLRGKPAARAALRVGSPLSDIEHHTYTHSIVRPLSSRPDKTPIQPEQIADEIGRTAAVLDEIGIPPPVGLRTPLGYPGGLDGYEQTQDAIVRAGIRFVSSDLRGPGGALFAPIGSNGQLRQPRRYPNGLIELPTHGWQDSAFTGQSRTRGNSACPQGTQAIIAAYAALFDDALRASADFIVGGVFHAYDCTHYDPELRVMPAILSAVTQRGGQVASYLSATEEVEPRVPCQGAGKTGQGGAGENRPS